MPANSALQQIRAQLRFHANEKDRLAVRRFFREQIEPYGVPAKLLHDLVRQVSPEIRALPMNARLDFGTRLFSSGKFEEGMIAIYLLRKFSRSYGRSEWRIFESWIDRFVTNWAHCDGISMHLLGACIRNEPKLATKLPAWAKSRNLWKRRASLASLVREARTGEHRALIATLIATLSTDKEPMIQKAITWIRREQSRHQPSSTT